MMNKDIDLLLKFYLVKPTSFALDNFTSFLEKIKDASITIQRHDDKILNIIIEKEDHLISLINFQAPVNFDKTILYQSITLNKQMANRLQIEKSPFLYDLTKFDKGVYYLNQDYSQDYNSQDYSQDNNQDCFSDDAKYRLKTFNNHELNDFKDLKPNLGYWFFNEKDEKVGYTLILINYLVKEAAIIAFETNQDQSILLKMLINKLCEQVNFVTVSFLESTALKAFYQLNGFTDWEKWYQYTFKRRKDINSFDDLINKKLEITKTKDKPSLLLHSCCGPCSSEIIASLSPYFAITILYYNPNIYPKSEFEKRLREQEKIIETLNLSIPLIVPNYQSKDFFKAIKGYELLGEGSKRCDNCYELRIKEAAIIAKKYGFDYFTTTLSISPHKDSLKINEIGIKIADEFNVNFLYSNFKLNNGYQKSIAISKKYHLYRQEYCGCLYSKNEFEQKKKVSKKNDSN